MSQSPTVAQIILKYLAWCQKNRSPRSLEWYAGHLSGFLVHLGEDRNLPVQTLKPFHVVEWVDGKETWGDTYKRGAIVAVQRCLNWGEEMGHIEGHSLKKIKKPPASRRDNPMLPEDYELLLGSVRRGDPFRDFLIFAWESGARPQEIRHLEARHVDLDRHRLHIPAPEAKGKRKARMIYLTPVTEAIIRSRLTKHPEGKLFRNTRGEAWTKYAICNRFHRLSRTIGKPLACYDARHGWATLKLEQGMEHLTVATLMGHTDATMLSKVYSHIGDRPDYLHGQLTKHSGHTEAPSCHTLASNNED